MPAAIDSFFSRIFAGEHGTVHVLRRTFSSVAVFRTSKCSRAVIVYDLDEGSVFDRLAKRLTLRASVYLASRILRKKKYSLSRFAIFPTTSKPSIIYELAGASTNYAEQNLVVSQQNKRFIRFLLSTIMGCHCSVGAVMLIGNRPIQNSDNVA